MGFVSTVPKNAGDLLKAAVKSAGANLPAIIEPAPIITPDTTQTGEAGVALAPTLVVSPLSSTSSGVSSTGTGSGPTTLSSSTQPDGPVISASVGPVGASPTSSGSRRGILSGWELAFVSAVVALFLA